MAKSKFSEANRMYLETRAGHRCEYCKASVVFIPHSFTVDHIIPIILGGTDELENLAYACYGCNRCKYNRITGLDPFSQMEVALFNPRTQFWKDHFAWDTTFTRVLGLTAIGRATVIVLGLNRPELIRMRKELIEVDRHPPVDE